MIGILLFISAISVVLSVILHKNYTQFIMCFMMALLSAFEIITGLYYREKGKVNEGKMYIFLGVFALVVFVSVTIMTLF